MRVLAALVALSMLLVCQGATIKGYLTDVLCMERSGAVALDGARMWTEPGKHTVHCLLVSSCIASGFAVLQNTGTDAEPNYRMACKFDSNGNTQAEAYARTLGEWDTEVFVAVEGDIVDGKCTGVTSITGTPYVSTASVKEAGVSTEEKAKPTSSGSTSSSAVLSINLLLAATVTLFAASAC